MVKKLWVKFKEWLKGLDEEWDQEMAETSRPVRECQDVKD